VHGYHDAKGAFPWMCGVSNGGSRTTSPIGNENTIGGIVFILPWIEQAALYAVISAPWGTGAQATLPFGPPRDFNYYPPWQADITALQCPSCPGSLNYGGDTLFKGRNHYPMCVGDSIATWYAAMRGVFTYGVCTRIADITDGTSNTIMMGERASGVKATDVRGIAATSVAGFTTNPSLCMATATGGVYTVGTNSSRTLGSLWHNGLAAFVGFSTILPPNSPSCWNEANGDGVALDSASSYHPGGVNVLLSDASVRFISNTIDTGTLTTQPPTAQTGGSPYGIWGQMGSKQGGEAFAMP
jgi:hypothetical protein